MAKKKRKGSKAKSSGRPAVMSIARKAKSGKKGRRATVRTSKRGRYSKK